MSVTATPDPGSVQNPYASIAAELHRLADRIATVRGNDLADLHVELRITTKLGGQAPDVCAAKVATVDAVALALLDRPGALVETGPTHDWVYHKAESMRGPVKVDVFELITDPRVQETQSELDRLRAEVAELRARAAELTGLTVDELSA